MKKGPSFKERLINNTSNVGLFATSLFSAPYIRDLFTSAVEQTIGQPSTPQTYIPFVIAREAVGYLATPLIVKAGLQLANKAISFLAGKAKSWFEKKEGKSLSTAVALRPASAPAPQGIVNNTVATAAVPVPSTTASPKVLTAPQRKNNTVATTAVPVPRTTASPKALTALQRLEKLLQSNPEANKIVIANSKLAKTKLFNHPKFEALVPKLEALKPEHQQEFLAKFLTTIK